MVRERSRNINTHRELSRARLRLPNPHLPGVMMTVKRSQKVVLGEYSLNRLFSVRKNLRRHERIML